MRAKSKPTEPRLQPIPALETVLDENLRNEDIGFRLILANHLLKISALLSSVTHQGNFYNLYLATCGLSDFLTAQHDGEFSKEKADLELWAAQWKDDKLKKDGTRFERSRYNQKALTFFYVEYSRRLLRNVMRLLDRKSLSMEPNVTEIIGVDK